MKLRIVSLFAFTLVSCGDEITPMSEESPIGEWIRQDKFFESGSKDSSTVKYSLNLNTNNVAVWRMHINDSLKKLARGNWQLNHDTLSIQDYNCSRSEELIPVDCEELPVRGKLLYRWDGNRIWELHASGYPYVRTK